MRSGFLCAALLLALAAAPYRLALVGDVLTVYRGGTVVRQEKIAADLPEAERQKLRGGVWAVTPAGLTALLEDYETSSWKIRS